MTPEQRADTLVAIVSAAARAGAEGVMLNEAGVTLDRADLVPAVYWPKSWLADAFRRAITEERGMCAEAVRAFKGAPSRTALVRAVLSRDEPRPEGPEDPALARQLATVDLMAAEMKARLIEKRAKGDWRGQDPMRLLARLLQEGGELVDAVRAVLEGGEAGSWPDLAGAVRDVRARVLKHAADVGNFAMIVADAVVRWKWEDETPQA